MRPYDASSSVAWRRTGSGAGHAIADVRLEIEATLAGSTSGEPDTDYKPRARPMLSYAVATLLTALVAIPLGSYLRPLLRPAPRGVTRFEYDLPGGLIPGFPPRPSILAISPDGSQVAMVRGDGLYLRSMDELQARVLTGTQGEVVSYPFFSPDGRWVGYFSPNDGQLKKVPVGGGEPVSIKRAGGSCFRPLLDPGRFDPLCTGKPDTYRARVCKRRESRPSRRAGGRSFYLQTDDVARWKIDPVCSPLEPRGRD